MVGYQNGVSIAELIVYFPCLVIAVFLAFRHGFRRSSGWLFLVIFCLIRIVGACFDLATIGDPTNLSLYIGYSILQTIGLSPLELAALGLLSRLITSINMRKTTFTQPRHMKFIQLIVTVGLILGIVGGVNSSDSYASNGNRIVPSNLTKAGLGLFILSFLLIILSTFFLSFDVSHAELGEKRLLLAVALSLPFLLVRLIYSCIAVFGSDTTFRSNTTILLCMAYLMEFIVVVIYEAVGLTLQRVHVPPVGNSYVAPHGMATRGPQPVNGTYDMEHGSAKGPSVGHQVVDTLGRRTFIGRLITGEPRQSRRDRRRMGG
jgi:hypothetical protein